jgi:hypothetical protein
MNMWLTVRTFCALFLLTFGIGLIFGGAEHLSVTAGAFLAALGMTFLMRMAIALRGGTGETPR